MYMKIFNTCHDLSKSINTLLTFQSRTSRRGGLSRTYQRIVKHLIKGFKNNFFQNLHLYDEIFKARKWSSD